MKKVKPIKINKSIDLSHVVNIETGEFLIDEIGQKQTLNIKEKTNNSLLKSDNYVILDTESMLYLSNKINKSDLGSIMAMSILVKTTYNILYHNNIPYCNTTLQEYLNIKSKSNYFKLIKRLIELNIIYPTSVNIRGKIKTGYMMNPFLCRKRFKFDESIFEIFKDFK